MQVRELPRLDWSRLAGTPLAPFAAALPPGSQILIVEDKDGAIVGQWGAIRYLHAEGLWIADAHRKRGVVFGHLLAGMRRLAEASGDTALLTAADDDTVRTFIRAIGGQQLPGEHYAMPVVGLPCR